MAEADDDGRTRGGDVADAGRSRRALLLVVSGIALLVAIVIALIAVTQRPGDDGSVTPAPAISPSSTATTAPDVSPSPEPTDETDPGPGPDPAPPAATPSAEPTKSVPPASDLPYPGDPNGGK